MKDLVVIKHFFKPEINDDCFLVSYYNFHYPRKMNLFHSYENFEVCSKKEKELYIQLKNKHKFSQK
jgi:hypothetical protein